MEIPSPSLGRCSHSWIRNCQLQSMQKLQDSLPSPLVSWWRDKTWQRGFTPLVWGVIFHPKGSWSLLPLTSGTLKLRHSTMTCSIWNTGLFFWYSLSKTRSSWQLAKWLKVKLDHEIGFRHNNGQESSIQTVLPPAPISYPLNWNQAFLEKLATRNSSGWMVTTSQAKNLPNVIPTVAAWMPEVKKLMNLAEFSRWEGSHQRAEVQGRNSW